MVALDLLLIRCLLLNHVLVSPLHGYSILPLHLSQMMLLSDIPRDGDQKGSEVVLAIQSLGFFQSKAYLDRSRFDLGER